MKPTKDGLVVSDAEIVMMAYRVFEQEAASLGMPMIMPPKIIIAPVEDSETSLFEIDTALLRSRAERIVTGEVVPV